MRAVAILLASTVAACAADERSQPHWPETLAPVAKPAKKPEVRGWVRHTPPKIIIKRDVVSKPEKLKQDEQVCAPPYKADGDQYVGEEGAKDQAEKAWSQSVRADYGERMMDIKHARDIHFACWRSSVGSLAGQTFHRCKIMATPCQAPLIRVEK